MNIDAYPTSQLGKSSLGQHKGLMTIFLQYFKMLKCGDCAGAGPVSCDQSTEYFLFQFLSKTRNVQYSFHKISFFKTILSLHISLFKNKHFEPVLVSVSICRYHDVKLSMYRSHKSVRPC